MKRVARNNAAKYVIVAALVFVIGLAVSRAAEKITAPEKIALTQYDRTAGVVTFSHKDHGSTGSERPGCITCHHTTGPDQTPEACGDCHKPAEESGVPADIVAFHKLCIKCHKQEIERGNSRASITCDSCHTPEK